MINPLDVDDEGLRSLFKTILTSDTPEVLTKYLNTGGVIIWDDGGKPGVGLMQGGYAKGGTVGSTGAPFLLIAVYKGGQISTRSGKVVDAYIDNRDFVPVFILMEEKLVNRWQVNPIALRMGEAALKYHEPTAVVDCEEDGIIDFLKYQEVPNNYKYLDPQPPSKEYRGAYLTTAPVLVYEEDGVVEVGTLSSMGGNGTDSLLYVQSRKDQRIGDCPRIAIRSFIPVFGIIEMDAAENMGGLPLITRELGMVAFNSLPDTNPQLEAA